jgi:hypothetical protein
MTRKRSKVIPLKTTQQLHADLSLKAEELEAARLQIESQEKTISRLREAAMEEKGHFANVLTAIRDAVRGEHDAPLDVPFRLRLAALFFPGTVLRRVIRSTRLHCWSEAVARIQECNYQRHYDAPEVIASNPIVTTVKKERLPDG